MARAISHGRSALGRIDDALVHGTTPGEVFVVRLLRVMEKDVFAAAKHLPLSQRVQECEALAEILTVLADHYEERNGVSDDDDDDG